MYYKFFISIFIILFLSSPRVSFASIKLRVCSQNIARVGKPPFGVKKDSVAKQTNYLVSRFIEAKCDVISVQEVYGKTKAIAKENLDNLTTALARQAGTSYNSFVGDAQYDEIRNGFILRENIAKVIATESPLSPILPKLNPLEKTRVATRSPFAILLDVSATKHHLLLIGLHLKSKVGGFKDPSGLDFETVRMKGAEQTRSFAKVLKEKFKLDGELVSLILGDRNSRSGSATDIILQGALSLEDFRSGCGVLPDLKPDCQAEHQPIFYPTISRQTDRGSTKFRGKEELIDEIYVSSNYFNLIQGKKTKLNYGLVGEFFKGSDHKLVWVELPL